MTEKAKKIEFTVHPALEGCNREHDYVTEVGVGRVPDDHPNRYERWEVCIGMPDPTDLLATPEALEYSKALKEMWGIELAEGLRDYIGGKLSTMPPYQSVLGEDKIAPENYQQQCQDLADSYTVGTRTSTGGVKAKAKKYDETEKELKEAGFSSWEEALAKMRESGIIGQ